MGKVHPNVNGFCGTRAAGGGQLHGTHFVIESPSGTYCSECRKIPGNTGSTGVRCNKDCNTCDSCWWCNNGQFPIEVPTEEDIQKAVSYGSIDETVIEILKGMTRVQE